MPSVVTANRLRDGIVVYLAPDGGWTEEIGARAYCRDRGRGRRRSKRRPRRPSRRARSSPPIRWMSRSRMARSIHFPCASASAPRTAPH